MQLSIHSSRIIQLSRIVCSSHLTEQRFSNGIILKHGINPNRKELTGLDNKVIDKHLLKLQKFLSSLLRKKGEESFDLDDLASILKFLEQDTLPLLANRPIDSRQPDEKVNLSQELTKLAKVVILKNIKILKPVVSGVHYKLHIIGEYNQHENISIIFDVARGYYNLIVKSKNLEVPYKKYLFYNGKNWRTVPDQNPQAIRNAHYYYYKPKASVISA